MYPSVMIDDEAPVTLEDASSPISNKESEPNDDLNGPALLASLGVNAGEASTESSLLIGGWISPIDFAIQDMTSSRRSKSSVAIRLTPGALVCPRVGDSSRR